MPRCSQKAHGPLVGKPRSVSCSQSGRVLQALACSTKTLLLLKKPGERLVEDCNATCWAALSDGRDFYNRV